MQSPDDVTALRFPGLDMAVTSCTLSNRLFPSFGSLCKQSYEMTFYVFQPFPCWFYVKYRSSVSIFPWQRTVSVVKKNHNKTHWSVENDKANTVGTCQQMTPEASLMMISSPFYSSDYEQCM